MDAKKSFEDKEMLMAQVLATMKSANTTAAVLEETFFGTNGLTANLFPKETERKNWTKSKVYKDIWNLINKLEKKDEPQPNGKYNLRLPKSLYAALQLEAEQEDTSLNQLMVTKLAVSLQTYTNP